jgi:hypothetical protein
LRVISEPVATAALIPRIDDGLFVVTDQRTLKRIPTWFAVGEIALASWVLLALVLTLIYPPALLLVSCRKVWRRSCEIWVTLWPFVSALIVVAVVALFHLVGEDIIARLGQATLWSMSLFALTLAFAMTSIASAISLWRARTRRVRKLTLMYGVFVAPALLIAVAYFAYWGVIGLRTWS